VTAAVALADRDGADGLSMRRLAAELGVVPMALYKHFANKEALLTAMLDVVVAEIDPVTANPDWRVSVRRRILSARAALVRHPWASAAVEAQTTPSPVVLAYFDSMIKAFRDGGLSLNLTHHALHAMGSRLLGFSQEIFNDSSGESGDPARDREAEQEQLAQLATAFPSIGEMVAVAAHQDDNVVGSGCDDQFEFEFTLDLMLDGLEVRRLAEM
jgi:AcrR family transcriptional regulator